MPPGVTKTRNVGSLIENAEFRLTVDDLKVISEIMMQEAGIALSQAKASLIYSRLAKRIRKLGLSGFHDYCSLIQSSAGVDECKEMVAALTTNVTSFFREPHHFEHLRTKVLPQLIERAKAGERIRMWSAACSTGPEPYSMALTLLKEMPDASKYDIRILATDIDPNVLAVAASGIYEPALLEPVPEGMRRSWFKPLNDGTDRFQVKDELRRLIAFRHLNLIGNWPMKGKFWVIFCRNVVIYFDNQMQERVWSRFMPLLEDDAALYIGHSERVSGAAASCVVNDGVTVYKKSGGRSLK
ncbi:CheR family methyltransferase [Acidocella aminolytica]|uniref:Chemotaxis protein methyltransferase n=1 Tax=Acidocella aminolytica 101 = DSM 11237 TaxID=1120923 RepID=A0A0D6PCZ8_9PROT|nr:protein-glutamate O-methyltransferase CheR [Acidocella aminolytica]GAN79216.1 chemotaxis methyltransferase CheR [Acidocella aminolytica 101 = DSM 11237]GBQ44550.1 chemotaxis protein methyltransferase [Acidocella aminolytica 101 = DSM 11237]SHE92141.1 chemotaxis protein methyltransferase CheR [Acidocella aminolytica 101 = DSM 11237]